jgi:hypothetical protein
MDLKLISKNNVGTVVLFLLVIALSQAKAFNFLIDSALGRFFLIVCIVGLSYSHKILGVVGVLFVIIMFNSNMYYEGFGNKSNDDSSNDDSSDSNTQLDEDQIKAMIKEQIAEAAKNKASSENSSDSSSDSSSKKSKNFKASEGFDVLGMENSIKRGKQSNSIPVSSFMKDSDSISPYEGSSILGNFSPF